MADQWDGHERRLTIRRIDRFTNTIPIAVFCTFIILGVMSFGIISNNNRARESDAVTKALATCLLEQFAEHRQNSAFNHNRQNEKLGLPFKNLPSKALSPDQLKDEIKTTCLEFIK